MMDANFSAEFSNELERLFRLRRDVRRFSAEPVEAALVARVLDSMATAPSVGLSQPWRVVLFESADARGAASRAFEAANKDALGAQPRDRAALYANLKLHGMEAAPVQFAVFSDESSEQGGGLGRATMPEMLSYSCVCAIMQAWLTARALGLGLGWVSILDREAIARAAKTPSSWRLIGYFCLGRPQQTDDETPELERAGWERRRAPSSWLSRA